VRGLAQPGASAQPAAALQPEVLDAGEELRREARGVAEAPQPGEEVAQDAAAELRPEEEARDAAAAVARAGVLRREAVPDAAVRL
jgi:hypothetical protein